MLTNLFRRAIIQARIAWQGPADCFKEIIPFVENKTGLEIGGPSEVFRKERSPLPIYSRAARLDNCDFSSTTAWASHSDSFVFDPKKDPGRSIFCDGSKLAIVPDRSYDFVLSSHNLEHFANPVKALKEWRRVTQPGGALVLVLPDCEKTFDHRRRPTTMEHLLQDYENDTQEDDLTHVPEVLEMHDRKMHPVGTDEEFREQLLANYTKRYLHHHVFNTANSRELLTRIGMKVLAVETALPFHIFLLAQMV